MAIRIILILFLIHSAFITFAQSVFNQPTVNKQRIVLFHPTVSTLTHFSELIRLKVIDLNQYEVVGVHHQLEDYDYTQSEKFIRNNQLHNFRLHTVNAPLEADQLFQSNKLTSFLTEIVTQADAVLFFGGTDLPPAFYQEEIKLSTSSPDLYRHYFELSALFQLLGGSQNDSFSPLLKQKPDFIIRAFCLGMQTMNVATGGSLYQDIPSDLYQKQSVNQVVKQDPNNIHRYYWHYFSKKPNTYYASFHQIRIKPNGYFAKSLQLNSNSTPLVNSRHHQAINKLGKNLQSEATSMDKKIVEAISHKQYSNTIAVQFHPEDHRLFDSEKKYRILPSQQKLQTLPAILKNSRSYKMHTLFWKDFSNLVSINHKKRNKNHQ